MSKYKIIDGVAYEIKELDVSSLRADIDRALDDMGEAEKEKARLLANIKNSCAQFDAQIESYKKQVLNLEALIKATEDKKLAVVNPQEAKVNELDAHILSVRAELIDKKDVIESLLPNEAKKLGL